MNDGAAFAIIKQAVDDPLFLQRLLADLNAVLIEHGFDDSCDRAEVKRVMTALGMLHVGPMPVSGYADQQATTLETADSFKSGLRATVAQIERGFGYTMTMYIVAFYLGVVLVLAAILMAFFEQKSLLSIVFGGLGTADVIAYFITKPPQDLQFSRGRLAQLQAAFFNWFIDYTNWNGVLVTWSQEGKADLLVMKDVSTTLMDHTEKTMALIDKYCGPPRPAETMRAKQ